MRAWLLISCCSLTLYAGEPIAVWTIGEGRIAERAATPDAAIAPEEVVAAGAQAPAFLKAQAAPGVLVALAPSAAGLFREESDASGQRRLIFEVNEGAAEIEVLDRGPYSAVIVRGAALELEVRGTLFVVERVRRDADYAVLVRGAVTARTRAEIAKLLGKAGEFALLPRQGIAADTAVGLAAQVDPLQLRPQIDAPAASRASIADQALGRAPGGTPWDLDRLQQLRQQLLATSAAASAAVSGSEAAGAALSGGASAAGGAGTAAAAPASVASEATQQPPFPGAAAAAPAPALASPPPPVAPLPADSVSAAPVALSDLSAEMASLFADLAIDLMHSYQELGASIVTPMADTASAASYEALQAWAATQAALLNNDLNTPLPPPPPPPAP
ncbi:MAG: hypothetical protein N3B15_09830 [Planctomycetota bacterium]|nr:hypothetical protein [Planctomycetota bacterium]